MRQFIITDLDGKQIVHNRFDTKIEARRVLDLYINDRVDLTIANHIGLSEETLYQLELNEYVIREIVLKEIY